MPSVTYAQLIKLDTKCMRLFLMNRKISITGYHEKSELVQLVLNYNTDVYTSGNGTSRPFSDMLARQNSFTNTNNDNNNNNNMQPNRRTSPTNTMTDEQEQDQPQAEQQQTGNENATEEPMEAEASSDGRTSFKRINSLSELNSVNDIDKMTTRDMKIVLTRNFVNYTGCFEKDELKKKLIALYESNKQMENRLRDEENNNSNTAADTNVSSDLSGANRQRRIDDELCKICMDRLIDCVLIECGHMCSCVKCGKLLSECPICRQYVIRCIRVFKS